VLLYRALWLGDCEAGEAFVTVIWNINATTRAIKTEASGYRGKLRNALDGW